jgi:hypothetical protein
MAMVSSRVVYCVLSVPLFVGAAAAACGVDDDSKVFAIDGGSSSGDSTGSSSGGSSGGSSGASSSGGSSGSPAPDTGPCSDTFQPAILDGGGACGTLPFGQPAAQFQGIIDASDNNAYDGGTLEQGIYDAVIAERGSGNPGSWRETFVVGPNNRFTRVRQIDNGTEGGANETTYRSGSFTTTGNSLKLTFDCEFDDDAGNDSGASTIPYEVITPGCDTYYRYGAAGIRIWLKRR